MTTHEHATQLPIDTEGLPEATPPELVELADGDSFELEIAPVAKRIGDATVRMLAYNGSIPGPTLEVPQGATVTVDVDEPRRPRRDRALARAPAREPLRRHARHAGADPGRRDVHVPASTSPTRRLLVPPAHPRGLRAGARPVREHPRRARASRTTGRRPTASCCSRSTTSSSRTAGSRRSASPRRPTWRWAASATSCSSRGEPDLSLEAKRGEVVRLYLTNTANTRVFNVALPGARMKLVGGDSGRYEHEELVERGAARAVRARRRRRAVRRAR